MSTAVHHTVELLDGFALTVEWDRDPTLDWDQHWQIWVNGPETRYQFSDHVGYTDARHQVRSILARMIEDFGK